MTALARILARLRGPWVADDPAPDLSWLDRADGRTDPLPALPRDWLDDLPSGDLPAMAAPLGMARDDLGVYAEPVTVGEYQAPVPFVPALEPMPRHAFERIMADLDLLERAERAFADGRAYESGSRCRTESAATKRAAEHLADGEHGARRAALVLAGFTGAEAWAV